MKIPHICLFLCVNSVAIIMAYYRRCYASFSLCLITNSKFRLTRQSAINWCERESSSLAIITNETVQSAVEKFIKDRSSKLMNSDVLTNGYRFDLSNWAWINGGQSAIDLNSTYNTYRYVYLTVSSNTTYYLSDGPSTWKMKFICSYITHNTNCSSGFRRMGSRCYKIHNTTATWFTARYICLKEESDLATFEDGISSLTSEWIGRYWIGLRKEIWSWQYEQSYAQGSTSTMPALTTGMTTATPNVNTTATKMTKTTQKSTIKTSKITMTKIPTTTKQITTTTQTSTIETTKMTTTKIPITTKQITTATTKPPTTRSTRTSTPKFDDSTSQWHSTPTHTLDDDFGSKMSENSVVTVESEHSGFLPIIGIGIACLLILIFVIAVIVFIKNRRSRSGDHEPTNGNFPPPMTYKDDAPNTVYAAVMPNASEPVCSASEKNSNQTVYAELDLEPKRNISSTQRASNRGRFRPTSEETPGQAVYAEVSRVPMENVNGRSEDPSEYDNIQMKTDSVYANSAQTKV